MVERGGGGPDSTLAIRPELLETALVLSEREKRIEFLRASINRFHEGRKNKLLPFMRARGIETGALLDTLAETNEETGRLTYGHYIKPLKRPIGEREVREMSPDDIISEEERRMLAGNKDVRARRYSLREMGFGDMLDYLGLADFGFLVIANTGDLKRKKEKKENWRRTVEEAKNIIIWNGGWTSEKGIWQTDPASFVNENPGTVSIVVTPPGYGRNSWQREKIDDVVESGLHSKRGLSFIMALFEEMLDIRKVDKRRIITVTHSQNGARVLELPRLEIARRNRAWVVLSPAIYCHSFKIGNYGTLENLMGIGSKVPEPLSTPVARAILNRLTQRVDHEVVAIHRAVVRKSFDEGTTGGLIWAMNDLYNNQGKIEPRKWRARVKIFLASEDPLVDHKGVRACLLNAGFPLDRIRVFADLGHYFWLQTGQRRKDTPKGKAEYIIAMDSRREVCKAIAGFLKRPNTETPPSRKK